MSNHLNPMISKRPRGEAGFTLVEALCAIVILAFGLIAVANLLLVASTSNTTANLSTAATTLAVQQLEVLKGVPFNDPGGLLVAGGDLESDQGGYFTDPPAEIPGVGQIRVRWSIVDVDPQTKFITVRAESTALLIGARSRAEFTVFRSCTDATPAPGLNCPPVP
jgi:type II secretory pathway pseudopilin PulG